MAMISSLGEHVDVVQALIVGLFGIVSWFIVTYVKSQSDFNHECIREFEKIHDKLDELASDHYKLRGSHEANH